MEEPNQIINRLNIIEQECSWLNGERRFLLNKVISFEKRIKTLEAEITHFQSIQDSMQDSEDTLRDRLSKLMHQTQRNLVELQYALPSTYEEIQKLETVLGTLQQEKVQLSMILSFTTMKINSNHSQ